jgi:arylsulfatase A-like enzyme
MSRLLLPTSFARAAAALAGATALWLPACTAPATEADAFPKQPNLVLILVDDMGWQDTGVAFTAEPTPWQAQWRTPHLVDLAARGIRFSDAYSSGSVCTPTRAALLSGQSPVAAHITDWTLHVDRNFARPMPPLTDPDWCKAGLAPSPDLLPELLRDAGYRTIFIGKAHFGAIGTLGADPLNLGFDVNIAGHAAGAPASFYGTEDFGFGRKGPWGVPGLEAYHGEDIYLTEALTREMERELEEAADDGRPFFLDFSHYAVHTPIQPDARYLQHYLDAGLDPQEAAYATMIEGVDQSLGRLLAKLRELDLARDTLIVFTSDNGGLAAHSRGTTPMGTGKDTHNLPLRSGKASGFEGGIRVPFVVGWAEGTMARAGALDPTPLITTDLYPTFAALAGVPTARIDGTNPEGQDLRALWGEGTALPTRDLGWNYPHKWGPKGDRYEPFAALRRGDWKVLYWYERGTWELYDLATDLGETSDLSAQEPEKAASMRQALAAWLRGHEAQRPVHQDSGAMLPYPDPMVD